MTFHKASVTRTLSQGNVSSGCKYWKHRVTIPKASITGISVRETFLKTKITRITKLQPTRCNGS